MEVQTLSRPRKVHREQARFLRSPSLYRGFVGGRGSGKSWVGAYDLLTRARPGRTYLVGSPTGVMLRDTTFPTFKALAQEVGLWGPVTYEEQPDVVLHPTGEAEVKMTPYPSVVLTSGATIRFRTAEDPEKLRGPNLSGVWLDEASLMLHDAFLICIAALREGGELGWLTATFTPKGTGHWTYEQFGTARPDVDCFHARTADNPFNPPTFEDTLSRQYGGLSSSLSQQELLGEFLDDSDGWQVIPAAWVKAAQARWMPDPPSCPDHGIHLLTCLGVDVAYGGADATVIVPRHGPWFGKPKKYKGEETDSGQKAAALVLREYSHGKALIHVDAIGYGAACYEALREKVGGCAVAVNVARSSGLFDRSRKYALTNVRSAMYWLLREALDPETGDDLALPPDRELLADLTAPHFEVRASGIVVESKESIKERLGRSPDVGDAVALAHYPPGRAGPPVALPDPPREERPGVSRLARRGMFGLGGGDEE